MTDQTTPEVVTPEPIPAPVEEPKARRKPGPKPKRPVPSIGQSVIYRTDNGDERAAVISAALEGERANLVVFNHLGAFPALDVPFDPDGMESSWSWPVRN